MLGLYIHIPFCVSKCKYCDFNSFKLNLNDKEDYEKLAKSLVNLTENGILYRSNKNKYCLFEDSHLLKGRVDMTSTGDAFIIVEGM